MKKILFNKTFVQLMSFLGMILIIFPPLYSYGKYISIITILFVTPYLIKEVFVFRHFIKNKGGCFGIIFILGYCITIILSKKTDIVSTLHCFVWLIINYLVIYSYDKNECINDKKKQLYLSNNAIIIISLVISIISLILYFSLVSYEIGEYTIGIYGGRNSGITIDSIQMSWINFIGITSAIINMVLNNDFKNRLLFLLSIIINFVCMETTITRNTVYTIIALIAVCISALYFCYLKWNRKVILKIGSIVLVGILSVGFLFGVDKITKNGVSNLLSYSYQIKDNENQETNKPEINEPNENEINEEIESPDNTNDTIDSNSNANNGVDLDFDRNNDQYGFKYGLSGRFEIWMCGLNVLKDYPIFGVSTGDMVYQTYESNKDSPYIKIFVRPTVFTSQHNGTMQTLVASGIFGFIFSSLAVLYCLFKVAIEVFKNFGTVFKEKKLVAVLFGIVFTMYFIMNFGQTITYFMVSFINTYFWYVMHYLMYFYEQKENN